MKSMLANEEPDSDMELLFAEDDDDQGFTDVGDNASDVHMDSSSDEEDNAAGADDDMEGEKELERQAKEKKAAQRKRKAQEAIPAKFRKKVRIDSTGSRAAAQAPAPRPKKKSERASWLPTAADAPTRASSRSTTKLSKEALHLQMEEREARRLKQIKQMEKQAAKRKALERPPMTQAERLREAEIVERRNSKSLNRWEVAEKQREEERKAKLAALNERTLRGPVITFWSGTREWKDGGLKSFAVLEEKPKRYQRKKKDKEKEMAGANVEGQTPAEGTSQDLPTQGNAEPPPGETGPETGAAKDQDGDTAMEGTPQPPPEPTAAAAPAPPEAPSGMAMPKGPPSGLAAPAPAPSPAPSPSTEPHTSSVLAPPSLAPPADITTNGKIPSPLEAPKLNVLAQPKPESSDNSPATPKSTEPFIQARLHLIEPDTPVSKPSATPSEAPDQEPKPTTSTREAIIYQNFDNNALKDKSIQTQILFGRKMNKLGKPPAHPLCVITHHPARYRDPDTGLPFFNSYAYREIQRLKRGEYRFSGLLGAWVGAGRHAAQGVPERFLHPEAKGPKQLEKERKEEEEKTRKEEEAREEAKGEADIKAEAADGPKVEDTPAPNATETLEAGEAKG